jgi:subtilisin family serine protease
MTAIARIDVLKTVVRFAAAAVLACATASVVLPGRASADWVRNDQWQLKELNSRDAWRLSSGDGVVVAVIDSGVDGIHPDLTGQVLPGLDLVEPGGNGWKDQVGHGTTVGALIAGRNDDSNGVVGLAPKTRILPIRVLDKDNKYDDPAVVAKGIHWAVDHGATVVNLSLGGHLRSDVMAEALRYAASRDVVVVACTGNVVEGDKYREVWYPAREAGVVAVAGLDDEPDEKTSGTNSDNNRRGNRSGGNGGGSDDDSLWSGSLTGPQTVLTAPAVNLLGARPGGYWRVQGTSFAAPLVAATAALIRAKYPSLSAANVINRMIHTARDLGSSGRDDKYGYGEVDPSAALKANLESVTANPLGGNPAVDSGSGDSGKTAGGTGPGTGDKNVQPDGKASQSAAAREASGPAGGTDGVGVAATNTSETRRIETSAAVGLAVAALLLVFMVRSAKRQRRAERR